VCVWGLCGVIRCVCGCEYALFHMRNCCKNCGIGGGLWHEGSVLDCQVYVLCFEVGNVENVLGSCQWDLWLHA